MCGWVAQVEVENDEHFAEAIRRISHRGTRVTIKETNGSIIAHARLPIVGLSEKYDQPVETDDWLIAFSGEILDFREEDPTAECDLPLVVEGWGRYKSKALRGRDGFWNIVAIDKTDGTLHITCDYLGQKPAYYRQDVLAAASEPDALLPLGPVTFDEVYLAAIIKWGYCPEIERTPYNEIKKVRPGEHIQLDDLGTFGQGEVVDQLVPRPGDLRKEIELAVRRRVMASDVPVACLLSGGLDSSIVYTLASCYGQVKPYYVDLGDNDIEERMAVGAVAGKAKVIEVNGSSLDIPMMEQLDYMQEPIDLGSLVPQIALARVIPENVCLTGDGADEVFGGYGRAYRYDSQGSDIFHELPAWHLPRLDRVMMRHLIEVRSPFLSRRVVEIGLSLPRELRTGKQILREIFRDILPKSIADRAKKPLRMVGIDEAHRIHMVNEFKRRHYICSEMDVEEMSR
jgi:asparagine synthase (glutamine-hydrolysing)